MNRADFLARSQKTLLPHFSGGLQCGMCGHRGGLRGRGSRVMRGVVPGWRVPPAGLRCGSAVVRGRWSHEPAVGGDYWSVSKRLAEEEVLFCRVFMQCLFGVPCCSVFCSDFWQRLFTLAFRSVFLTCIFGVSFCSVFLNCFLRCPSIRVRILQFNWGDNWDDGGNPCWPCANGHG